MWCLLKTVNVNQQPGGAVFVIKTVFSGLFRSVSMKQNTGNCHYLGQKEELVYFCDAIMSAIAHRVTACTSRCIDNVLTA